MFKYLIVLSLGLGLAACSSVPAAKFASEKPATSSDSEVTFKGADGFELAGTLALPPGSDAHPAFLLLPGSGPTDRDGNSKLLDVKVDLLKQLADQLAAAGYASLRFDKRAIARYQASWPKSVPELNKFFSWRHFVEDAEGGLAYLRSRPEIDPKRVYMLGHSEGALITLQVASEIANPPVGLVLMGSTGRPMGAVLHDQIARSLGKNPGVDPKPYLDYTDSACAALAAGKPLPANPPQGLGGLFNGTVLDIMGAYCRIDPTVLAGKYNGPVLIINGGDDTQVSPIKDTKPLAAAFKARSQGTSKVLIVPTTSHNLKSTASGNPDAVAGPVDPSVPATIIAWLKGMN